MGAGVSIGTIEHPVVFLDKKGINADEAIITNFAQKKKTTITGDAARDTGIRQRGLATRYDYLKVQRSYAPTKSMRTCSMFTIASLTKKDENGIYTMVKEKGLTTKRKHYIDPDKIPDMMLKTNQYGSAITGLQTCDNPQCVMCSRGKAMERAEKISNVLKWVTSHKCVHGATWSPYFVTLTVERQANARTAVQDIQKRWRAVQKSLQYRYKGRKLAFSRAVDVTFRPDWIARGQCYHVHLHCIVMIEGVASRKEVQGHIVKAWKGGGDFSIKVDEQGQDVQEIRDNEQLSKYVAKMGGLGLELASSQTKKGHGGSLSLPQVLESIIDGNTKNRRVYRDYLEMMKGVRTMSFSKEWNELEKEFKLFMEENPPAEGEKKRGYEMVIPPSWWAVCISMQSPLVQAAYMYNERLNDGEYMRLLERLVSMDPPNRHELLEKWCHGALKGWHLDALEPCQP